MLMGKTGSTNAKKYDVAQVELFRKAADGLEKDGYNGDAARLRQLALIYEVKEDGKQAD